MWRQFTMAMGVYEGYALFRELGGEIKVVSFLRPQGLLNIVGERPVISIRKGDSLEEQVKTLLHELIHLSSENWRFWGQHLTKDDPVEMRIEQETEIVYSCQPRFVEHLREKIRSARYQK